jgi:crotonobetainyl-CoA:carnitine CoA-transferase CaiB-like acyl-CoA transferase
MTQDTAGNGTEAPRLHPRIADFSTHLSGPFASRILSDLGADVIKIENPRTGDGNRGVGPFIHGVGNLHGALSAGARSLAVDRRSRHWDSIVQSCIRWADVVLVGARPSDAARLGLDFASVAKIRADTVYCLISGYGEDGPWRDFTAHGQTMDAMAGLVPVEWEGETPRTPVGWRSSGTTLAGIYAAVGIMYALYQRERGARGALHVSIPVWSAAMAWSWRDVNCLSNLGHPWNEYQDLGSRYAMYGTADHRALILAPIEQKFWEQFCDVAGLAHLRADGSWGAGMDFGRGVTYESERVEIARAVGARSLQEWVELLSATGIPFAPVLTLAEALGSEHAAALGVLRDTTIDGQPARVPGSPVRVTDADHVGAHPGPVAGPPRLGQHTDEVLAELGLSELAGRLGAP